MFEWESLNGWFIYILFLYKNFTEIISVQKNNWTLLN